MIADDLRFLENTFVHCWKVPNSVPLSLQVKINEDPAAALIRELQEELERMKHGVAIGGQAASSKGGKGPFKTTQAMPPLSLAILNPPPPCWLAEREVNPQGEKRSRSFGSFL